MINLLKYSKDNIEHKNLINKLSMDKDIKNNVSSILYPNNNTYVINLQGINIGILKINKELNDYYSIDIGILEAFRLNNYGSTSLLLLDNYIDNFNKILLRTKYDNNKLVNCAMKVGYLYDDEETEKCIDEGTPYLVLSRINKEYKKD